MSLYFKVNLHFSVKMPLDQKFTAPSAMLTLSYMDRYVYTVQITFIFIDFRVCDFAFAFKTQNAPCVSRFKRVLFSDRFQFAF